ncbi:MAG: 2Fe-2S iron-sulfur cluster binding domain-containing protein [Gammaproteobacteria bacterium]|nr:2Fe-2S iron-sulfur cluster binding domain-containing protein [Gammaproteobacteria bacterium]
MQKSVGLMHEGLDALGAGIAARRVLAEGKAPRNLALDWFKREMNLASPIGPEMASARPGIASFHLFAMVLLVTFAIVMVAMYFFKMRRTAALFKRIEPGPDGPPPSGSPPSNGGPSGSAPTDSPGAGGAEATLSTRALSAVPVSQESTPATANWRGRLRVGSIVTETPNVKTFRLLSTTDDRRLPFSFIPGQFLNTTFWIGGARMNRSYSISSSPTQRGYAELTVRREPRGAVSRHINDLLKVGDHVDVEGPVGKFTFDGSEANSVVLIAGGVGITPMMSIARYLTEQAWAGDIFLIYACRAPADFIFANELAVLQRANPKLHVTVTMSRPEGTDWPGPRGRLTKELLTQAVPDLAARRVHLCGPPSMMEATKALLTALGVAAEQLKTEAFGAPKPALGPGGTTSNPTVAASGPLVTFSKHNKSAKIHAGQTILELSEELAIGIEFSCRVGTCGICKVTMTSGEVEMAVEDALSPEDKTNGVILACQAKPKAAVTVEA